MELKLQGGSALVIVAHPDDETIWMGGIILVFPKVRWTIFSLSRSDDPDRAPRFQKVCRALSARALISDLEDEGVMSIKDSLPEIRKRIISAVGHQRFDYLFTHGSNGEYGHRRHIGVHRTVKKMIKDGELLVDQIFYFDYLTNQSGRILSSPRADWSVKLPPKTFKAKRDLIKNWYGFSSQSFENRSCRSLETFKGAPS